MTSTGPVTLRESAVERTIDDLMPKMRHEVLVLPCSVPSKKNALRPGRGSKFHYDSELRAQLDAITFLIKARWGNKPPMKRAYVEAKFYVDSWRGDGDGKYTALQDSLVAAGVIVGDTMARIPGHAVTAEKVRPGEQPSVRIELTELEDK